MNNNNKIKSELSNESQKSVVQTSAFKQTDIGLIPSDWEIKYLKDIAQFTNGKAHENSIDENGDYIVVNSKFVSTEGSVFKCSNLALSPLSKGDIAMVMSDIPNGKALAKCFLVKEEGKYTLNQRICSLRTENCDTDFLYRILNRNEYFLAFDSGTGQTNLRRQEVLDCPIPLPPTISEQTAIATALSDTDAYISSLEKLIAKKQAIKQGAMQQLLSPKADWVVKKVSDLCEVSRGRVISHREINSSMNYAYPVYSSQTTNDGIMGYIDTYDFDGEYITWTTDGEKAGTVFYRNGKFNCTNVCGTLKLRKGNAKYFAVALNQIATKHVSRNLANPKLMNDAMKKIEIALPDPEDQTRIATILSDMDTEIAALEKQLAKARSIKQGMMQNLLTGKIRLNH